MTSPGYFARIARAQDRAEAATLIRAHALRQVALLYTSHPLDRLHIAEEAEEQAEKLEREWVPGDDDAPAEPPWREWLADWGYTLTKERGDR